MNNRWIVEINKNRIDGSSSVLHEPLFLDFSASSQKSPDSWLETRLLSHKEIKRRAERAMKRWEERKAEIETDD